MDLQKSRLFLLNEYVGIRKAGKQKRTVGLYACSCGNIRTFVNHHVKSGITKSCGCLQRDLSKSRAPKLWEAVHKKAYERNKDLIGVRHGRLVVTGMENGDEATVTCDCGKELHWTASRFRDVQGEQNTAHCSYSCPLRPAPLFPKGMRSFWMKHRRLVEQGLTDLSFKDFLEKYGETYKELRKRGCITAFNGMELSPKNAVTVDGICKTRGEWAKALGLTRERIRQLLVAGKLETRIRAFLAKKSTLPHGFSVRTIDLAIERLKEIQSQNGKVLE